MFRASVPGQPLALAALAATRETANGRENEFERLSFCAKVRSEHCSVPVDLPNGHAERRFAAASAGVSDRIQICQAKARRDGQLPFAPPMSGNVFHAPRCSSNLRSIVREVTSSVDAGRDEGSSSPNSRPRSECFTVTHRLSTIRDPNLGFDLGSSPNRAAC